MHRTIVIIRRGSCTSIPTASHCSLLRSLWPTVVASNRHALVSTLDAADQPYKGSEQHHGMRDLTAMHC